MQNKDFCVFILTHGRPDNVITYRTLKKCGYTGKIYFIVDNEDKTVDKYIRYYGAENVRVFDKKAMADKIDEGNNFDNRKVIVHARNYCFGLAKELGITYFIQLDDDYTAFEFRYENYNGTKLLVEKVKNLDLVLGTYLEFYKKTNFNSIAFAQGGDYIGGVDNSTVKNRSMKRKAMNSFICSTERPFQFVGAINEDVNTYTALGSRGNLFGTIPMVSLTQAATQSQKGGMTDIYLLSGTYVKSFTTVLMSPSSVSISMMGASNRRLHHSIKWLNTTPVIISEKHKRWEKIY